MFMQSRFSLCSLLVAASALAAVAQVQSPSQAQSNGARSPGAILQEHYDAAEHFQQQGNLEQAGRQYRLFVADALAELALGEARLGEYAKAAPFFDGALALEPNSPQLRLDYARAAMSFGDLDHAQMLALQLLAEEVGNPRGLAAAHEVLGRTLLRMNQDQEARKELETAVALEPNFDNAYNLAVACLDLDDEKCADSIFTRLEATYGDTPAIHMDFGRAWGESDFQPRAEEEFRKVIAEDPRFPEAHYCLAATYLQENESTKIQAAETELEKELTVSPKDFLTYAALGKLAALRQRYAAAEKYLQRAIQLNPKNPDAYLYLGQMYFNTSRPADAETALRQAIRLTMDPSRNRYQVQKAHYLLGRIVMKQGKGQEAAAEMKIAQALLQHSFVQDKNKMTGLLGTAGQGMGGGSESSLALGDTTAGSAAAAAPAAVRKLEEYRKQIAPAVADSYNNLGDIAAVNKDYSTAVSYFQSAAEWNPSLEGLDLNWGRAAFAGSRFADAILPLSRYLKAHPDDNGARSVLAISLFMTENYKDCIATVRSAPGKTDFAPQVDYVYAESLIMTGQTASGMERLEALAKSHPEIPDVHRALAEVLDHGGQRQKAMEELRTAIQLNARDAESHYDLGKMEVEGGDTAAAIPELEAAVRLLPDSEKYHEELARAYKAASRTADEQKEIQAYNGLRMAHARAAQTNAPPPQETPPQP